MASDPSRSSVFMRVANGRGAQVVEIQHVKIRGQLVDVPLRSSLQRGIPTARSITRLVVDRPQRCSHGHARAPELLILARRRLESCL
jgi:hypothetical protein